MSLYDRAGGRDGLERVLVRFYDAVFSDLMIGYLFAGQDKARLVARELELMAAHFGADDLPYQGRPLGRAHLRHRILAAHFDRRRVLLAETLDAMGVDPEVKEAWLAHTDAQRELIIRPERCED